MDINWNKAPADATHYLPETKDTFECWIKPGYSMQVKHQKKWVADDTGDVEYLFIPRPMWNGEGLPPVGTVCEYYADEDSWRQCEIVAHKDGKAVVWVSHAHIWSTSSGSGFRPLKTKEQLAAEEREKAVLEMRRVYEELLEANEDHAWSWDEIFGVLHDAGYRKQENNDAKA